MNKNLNLSSLNKLSINQVTLSNQKISALNLTNYNYKNQINESIYDLKNNKEMIQLYIDKNGLKNNFNLYSAFIGLKNDLLSNNNEINSKVLESINKTAKNFILALNSVKIKTNNYSNIEPLEATEFHYSSPIDTTQLQVEPYPKDVLQYWYKKYGWDNINPENYTVMYDKNTDNYLGLWPKNANLNNLTNAKTYGIGNVIWPTTGVGGNTYNHAGQDIDINFAEPIYAPITGTVLYSEWGHTIDRFEFENAYSVRILLDNPFIITGDWKEISSSPTISGTKTITEIYLTHLAGIRYRSTPEDGGFRIESGELIGWGGSANAGGDWAPHLHMSFYTEDGYQLYTPDMKKYFDLEIDSDVVKNSGN